MPDTPTLDSFTRADENPLGAAWDLIAAGTDELQLVSNTARSTGSSGTAAWNATTYGDVESWTTISDVASGGGRLYARISGLNTSTYTGYALQINTASHFLKRYDSGSGTAADLGNFTQAISSGDSLMLRCVGSSIEVLYRATGTTRWEPKLVATDSTYSSGYIGIGVSSSATFAHDAFGGGTAPSIRVMGGF